MAEGQEGGGWGVDGLGSVHSIVRIIYDSATDKPYFTNQHEDIITLSDNIRDDGMLPSPGGAV